MLCRLSRLIYTGEVESEMSFRHYLVDTCVGLCTPMHDQTPLRVQIVSFFPHACTFSRVPIIIVSLWSYHLSSVHLTRNVVLLSILVTNYRGFPSSWIPMIPTTVTTVRHCTLTNPARPASTQADARESVPQTLSTLASIFVDWAVRLSFNSESCFTSLSRVSREFNCPYTMSRVWEKNIKLWNWIHLPFSAVTTMLLDHRPAWSLCSCSDRALTWPTSARSFRSLWAHLDCATARKPTSGHEQALSE